jgi:fatty acid desaturase
MEATEEKKCCETKKKCCFCRKMPAVFVVLIGVAVLLRALEVLGHKPFWITIAILVILAGLQQLCCGMCKCCDKSGDGES